MKKGCYVSGIVLLLIAALGAYIVYGWIWRANVPSEIAKNHITIPSDASFETVVRLLIQDSLLIDSHSFRRVAKWMKYDRTNVPGGKYRVEAGWSNRALITRLRSGIQEAVQVTFNQVRTTYDLAGAVSQYIEADSMTIQRLLSDSLFLADYGFTPRNAMAMFIPNTYQFYWNTSAEQFFRRMKREYDQFWDANRRLQKADSLGLSSREVYTLASIVEKETLISDEKPTVAGVYINRLNRGIKLQADPTVVFAVGDFSIRRVLNRHLEVDSPYNTYIYEGLPPGPICMPGITSIDAVLNAEYHDYIFFCAKPGYGGRHAFAKTLAGHNRNARAYRQWLNQNRI